MNHCTTLFSTHNSSYPTHPHQPHPIGPPPHRTTPQVAVPNAKTAGILGPHASPPQVTVSSNKEAFMKGSVEGASSFGGQRDSSSSSSIPSAGKNLPSARYRLMEGDAFGMASWGESEYDVIFIPHCLHVVDPPGMRKLLEKAKKALKPDGRRVVISLSLALLLQLSMRCGRCTISLRCTQNKHANITIYKHANDPMKQTNQSTSLQFNKEDTTQRTEDACLTRTAEG